MAVNLTNSNDIAANSVSLANTSDVVNVLDQFYKKHEVIEDIVGLPPDTLNTLHELEEI